MKKILFPATNRVHLARQKLLLDELRFHFDVSVEEYQSPYNDILNVVADCANHYRNVINNPFDLVLIRGDRYEMLPIAMLCAYRGTLIAHIEGGDISGAIDNKVRHALTQLADIHFATNEESHIRLIGMGVLPSKVFNFGSLDAEYAASIRVPKYEGEPYLMVVYHPLAGEDIDELEWGLRFWKGKIVRIKSNKDSGKTYGKEEYSPEEYIGLMANARCLVGNSSSFLKEASVLGTPTVNVGGRQKLRLMPQNVLSIPVRGFEIENAIKYQLEHGRYQPSSVYFQEGTSKKITEQLVLYENS